MIFWSLAWLMAKIAGVANGPSGPERATLLFAVTAGVVAYPLRHRRAALAAFLTPCLAVSVLIGFHLSRTSPPTADHLAAMLDEVKGPVGFTVVDNRDEGSPAFVLGEVTHVRVLRDDAGRGRAEALRTVEASFAASGWEISNNQSWRRVNGRRVQVLFAADNVDPTLIEVRVISTT